MKYFNLGILSLFLAFNSTDAYAINCSFTCGPKYCSVISQYQQCVAGCKAKDIPKCIQAGEAALAAEKSKTPVTVPTPISSAPAPIKFEDKANVSITKCANGASMNNSTPCDTNFASKLDTAKTKFTQEIDRVLNKAFAILNPQMKNAEVKNLSAKYSESLLNQYMQSPSAEFELTPLGKDQEKIEAIKSHMQLSSYVYTNEFSKEFKNTPEALNRQWDALINKRKLLFAIKDDLTKLKDAKKELLSSQKEEVAYSAGVPVKTQKPKTAEETEEQKKHFNILQQDIVNKARELSEHKITLQLNPSAANLDAEITKVDVLLKPIETEYKMWFSETSTTTNEKKSNFDKNVLKGNNPEIKYEGLFLKSEAKVASSFVSRMITSAGAFNNDQIHVLKVDFRNNNEMAKKYNNWLTSVLKPLAKGKSNPEAWFGKDGEVNYIAFINPDKNKSDEATLEIVFSGSNSEKDWMSNFRINQITYLGLPGMNAGIAMVHRAALEQIEPLIPDIARYLNATGRKITKINVSGHSLGAALAQLMAYSLSSDIARVLQQRLNYKNKIPVYAYLYAPPAFLTQESAKIVGENLPEDHIFNVATDRDLIVFKTEFRDRVHVGINIHLLDTQDVSGKTFLDIWGPHGSERYLTYIGTLSPATGSAPFKMKEIFQKFIEAEGLDYYKYAQRTIAKLMVWLGKDEREFKGGITGRLANDLSAPSTQRKGALPATVGAWDPTADKDLGDPVFNAGIESKVQLKVQQGKARISYDVAANTSCDNSAVTKIITTAGANTGSDFVSKFSCACCVAKHIFVSNTNVRKVLGVVRGNNPTTLPGIRNYCSRKHCTEGTLPNYTKSDVQQLMVFAGLGDQFNAKSISFPKGIAGLQLSTDAINALLSDEKKFNPLQNKAVAINLENIYAKLENVPNIGNVFSALFSNDDRVKGALMASGNPEQAYNRLINNFITFTEKHSVYKKSMVPGGKKRLTSTEIRKNFEDMKEDIKYNSVEQ